MFKCSCAVLPVSLFYRFLLTGVVLFALSGCVSEQTADPQKKQGAVESEENSSVALDYWGNDFLALPTGWQPANDVETVEQWADQLEAAIWDGDTAAAEKLADFNPVLDAVCALASNPQFRQGFKAGAKKGIKRVFAEISHPNAYYTFQQMLDTSIGLCPLFRLVGADGNLNYHVWKVAIDAKGQLVGVDLYHFVGGEPFSETMRRMLLLSIPPDSTLMSRLTGRDRSLVTQRELVNDFFKSHEGGHSKDVLERFNNLPLEWKQEKAVYLARLMAAAKVDDAEYASALSDLKRFFPGDSSLTLMEIDLHFLNKDYGKLLETLERLEQKVGLDAHLDYLRGSAWLDQKDFEKAQEFARKAIDQEPWYAYGYHLMIAVALEQKDFALLTSTLKSFVENLQTAEIDLQNEIYGDYRQTGHYREFTEFLESWSAEWNHGPQKTDLSDESAIRLESR